MSATFFQWNVSNGPCILPTNLRQQDLIKLGCALPKHKRRDASKSSTRQDIASITHTLKKSLINVHRLSHLKAYFD